MKRREFLSGGIAAAGGLIAMPTLSAAVGATRPSNPFSVNVISLDCGAEKPFSVFHITDTHLKAVAETDSEEVRRHIAKRFVGYDPEDALVASIAYARRRHIEYLLHTGDLIDCATDGNIALLKKYFGENGNILYAPGNHEFATTYAAPRNGESEADFRAVNTAKVQAAVPFDLGFSSRVVNGVNFVMIDDVYGTIAPRSVELFHEEVKKGLPIILALHVPICTEGLWRIGARVECSEPNPLADFVVPDVFGSYRIQMEDRVTADFIRELKRQPLLKAIFSGHWHVAASDRFSPTAMQYVGAANFRYFGQEILIH